MPQFSDLLVLLAARKEDVFVEQQMQQNQF